MVSVDRQPSQARRFAAASFEVAIDRCDGYVVVRPCGELDIHTAAFLRDTITDVVSATAGGLVLDLGELSFMDSMGLMLVLDTSAKCERLSRDFSVGRGRPNVHRVFELTRTDSRLRWHSPDPRGTADTPPSVRSGDVGGH
jgi:anti-sigma B factor antagonist